MIHLIINKSMDSLLTDLIEYVINVSLLFWGGGRLSIYLVIINILFPM